MSWIVIKKLFGSVSFQTWALLLVVVLSAAAQVRHQTRVHRLEGQVKIAIAAGQAAIAQRDQCRANVLTLKSSLDVQNRAVEAMRAEGEARVAESRKAVSAARSVAESYRREAGRVLAVKAGPDVCASADALILGAVR